ncbi:MAG: DUF6036 family nucleotidyltransferase [Gemmatimonadaceae bacterium]
MTREELEHAIRAACAVAQDDEVYVFGSQAILGQYPAAPATLRQSAEADVAPVHAVDIVGVIDASLGELSSFHQSYGYYVYGVSLDAAVLPEGWQRRAIAVRNANTNGATGWCVEAHDLAVSKLVAWRDKDRDFVRILLAEELVQPRTLLLRISQLPRHERAPEEHRARMRQWVKGIVRDLGRAS